MELGLKDQVAIVTGGSSGIGQAIARALASEKAKVAVVGRNMQRLQETVTAIELAGGIALAIQADLTQSSAIEKVVDKTIARFKGVNILVNSAGSAIGGAFLEIPEQQWQDALQLKVLGAIYLCQAVVPHMIKAGGGRIINITGGAGKEPTAVFLPGGVANGAFRNFSKGLALTLKPHNILVNAISPGSTLTPRVTRLLEQQAQLRGISLEELEKVSAADFVGGHITKPEEIAAVALFLASKQVVTLTGAEIDINGGTSQGL